MTTPLSFWPWIHPVLRVSTSSNADCGTCSSTMCQTQRVIVASCLLQWIHCLWHWRIVFRALQVIRRWQLPTPTHLFPSIIWLFLIILSRLLPILLKARFSRQLIWIFKIRRFPSPSNAILTMRNRTIILFLILIINLTSLRIRITLIIFIFLSIIVLKNSHLLSLKRANLLLILLKYFLLLLASFSRSLGALLELRWVLIIFQAILAIELVSFIHKDIMNILFITLFVDLHTVFVSFVLENLMTLLVSVWRFVDLACLVEAAIYWVSSFIYFWCANLWWL